MKKSIIIVIGMGVLSIMSFILSNNTQAQVNVSATPLPVIIPTSTIPSTQIVISTPTPTVTATEEGPITLSLSADAETANMRADPDPGADVVGTMGPGEEYRVLGVYFSWIQFEVDSSPNGKAWVFGELVEINGDFNEIPVVDPFAEPTDVPQVSEATLTWEAITLTPGGILTATAQSRIIVAPNSEEANQSAETSGASDILPTFTVPPDFLAQQPTEISGQLPTATPEPDLLTDTLETVSTTQIPPIAFILGLGGMGVLGILIASLRR